MAKVFRIIFKEKNANGEQIHMDLKFGDEELTGAKFMAFSNSVRAIGSVNNDGCHIPYENILFMALTDEIQPTSQFGGPLAGEKPN